MYITKLPRKLMKESITSKMFMAVIFFMTPSIVLANAGSPLIWFNVFHLLVINAVIGYIESEILSKFKLPNKTWMVIVANYISMIIGFYAIIPGVVKPKYGRDLWSGESGDLLTGFLLSFIVTLVIEYPFFVGALKDKKQKKALLKPFIVANVVTNIAMVCIYYLFMASQP